MIVAAPSAATMTTARSPWGLEWPRAVSSRLQSSAIVTNRSGVVASWPNPMGAGPTRLHVPEAAWRGGDYAPH
jgi:hypothetical protein